jgi:hypothetical protein
MNDLFSRRGLTQERIVFLLAVMLFVAASLALKGFFTARRDCTQRQRPRNSGTVPLR